MKVFYRLCPLTNPNKLRPIRGKIPLIKACFNSFKEAFKDVKPAVHFILDNPTDELYYFLKGECPFDYVIEEHEHSTMEGGNQATYFRQLDLASQTEDKVFLLEDDYFFLSMAGKVIENALDTLDIVTPYDHPQYYVEQPHLDFNRQIRLVDNHHFSTTPDTTLTFATTGKIIKENIELFKSHSFWDAHMWREIREKTDLKLWYPIPSLATHMESDFLSPSINWEF